MDGPKVETVVGMPAARVWRCWADPAALAEWFGTSTGRLDIPGPLRIDFGDGDFFAVDVLEVAAPTGLRLRWRLLGIGDEDQVRVDLDPVGDARTRVAVGDSGLLGPDAPAVLGGWRDFLARLSRYATTGERSRYEWSPEIAFSVTPSGELPDDILDQITARLTGVLPQAPTATTRRLLIAHPLGVKTSATVSIRVGGAGRGLTVEHTGFDSADLPVPHRIALRRYWVGRWLDVLRDLDLVPP
ncbi:SRPBCC family protein [Actinokineospora sp.]|uniref:SRPBCC family protein n=1 Tax=Actinokineospora sp. TaxID=1872133 RepID=UPI0040376D02